jgi:hypothetical protein
MHVLQIHEHTTSHVPWKQVNLHVVCEEVNTVGSSNGGVDRFCLHGGKDEVCNKRHPASRYLLYLNEAAVHM